MKSVKQAIFKALTLTTVELIALLDDPDLDPSTIALIDMVGVSADGIEQIFPAYPPTTAVYPCVGFYRISGQAGNADGKLSKNKNELYSIDCFAMNTTVLEDIENAVDMAMDTLDYTVTAEHGSDLFEDTTKVHHKVLRYRIK